MGAGRILVEFRAAFVDITTASFGVIGRQRHLTRAQRPSGGLKPRESTTIPRQTAHSPSVGEPEAGAQTVAG